MKEGFRELIAAAQTGDKPAMDTLLRDNTPLVWSVARRFFGRGCEPEDLFQLGSIGLLKAVRDFDLSQPVAFSTYAVPKIAGEMRRFLRDDGPVKVSRTLKERAFSLRQIQSRWETETGRSPHLSDLCRESGLSREDVLEALNAPRDTDSLDAFLPGQERTLGEVLPDEETEEDLARSLAVRQAIDDLEPKLRQVILLRYHHGYTQRETAKILGMGLPALKQADRRARERLRQMLKEQDVDV